MIDMKGQGGITIYNALLFYTVFLLFLGFIGSQAGITILTVGGNPYNIPIPSGILDIIGLFGLFTGLMATNSTFLLITVIFITPFLILLSYALMQLIRGPG